MQVLKKSIRIRVALRWEYFGHHDPIFSWWHKCWNLAYCLTTSSSIGWLKCTNKVRQSKRWCFESSDIRSNEDRHTTLMGVIIAHIHIQTIIHFQQKIRKNQFCSTYSCITFKNSFFFSFAVWNTMLGSSLLAISWGIEKTGLFPGIILNFLIGAICLYTAYLLLRVNEKHSKYCHNMPGFHSITYSRRGRWIEYVIVDTLWQMSRSLVVYMPAIVVVDD